MSNYSVIIVDDEEELVTTIAERLELRGFKTQTATDGETALNLIKANPPQVVVLDVMMPGLSGIDILKQMNALKMNIPVILLTGYGSNEQGAEGLKQGAFDYLMKPCDLNVLIDKIQEAIEG